MLPYAKPAYPAWRSVPVVKAGRQGKWLSVFQRSFQVHTNLYYKFSIFQVWSFWYYLGFPSLNPTKQRLTISLPQSRISEEKVYKSKLLFWVKSLHSCVIYFWCLLFIKVALFLMPYCVQSIGSTTKQMSPLACILVSHSYSRNSCWYKHYTWQENTLENTDKIWQYYKTFLQLVRLLLECVDHINTVNV